MWYLPGPGWREGGGGRMGEGLLRRDASSALVTRQLCNSAEAEVGEAVRSPLFTHQPHPLLPNTQTLRAPRQMRTFSGELLVLYVASAEQDAFDLLEVGVVNQRRIERTHCSAPEDFPPHVLQILLQILLQGAPSENAFCSWQEVFRWNGFCSSIQLEHFNVLLCWPLRAFGGYVPTL